MKYTSEYSNINGDELEIRRFNGYYEKHRKYRNGKKEIERFDFKNNLLYKKDDVGEEWWNYNERGQEIFHRDYKGNETETIYDSNGKFVKRIENSKVKVINNRKYEYDERGNTTKIINPDGSIIELKYDNNNNLIKAVYPDRSYEDFKYDNRGNVIYARNRNGDTHTLEYNEYGCITKYIDSNDNECIYEYSEGVYLIKSDENGRLRHFNKDDYNGFYNNDTEQWIENDLSPILFKTSKEFLECYDNGYINFPKTP